MLRCTFRVCSAALQSSVPDPHELDFCVQMLAWAFEPASEDILLELIAKGRKDAFAWAQETEACGASTEGVCDFAAQRLSEQHYPALSKGGASSSPGQDA